MPRLRRLSGAEAISILSRFGFTIHSQRGSHVKLLRELPDGAVQTLTVPAHPDLDTGTCRAILRQAGAFAVLRLITSSNLVGCSTGRSAGFAPLKIRST